MKRMLTRLMAFVLALCLAPVWIPAQAEDDPGADWIKFLLICNEGMNNDKGNAGNTLMVVSMHPVEGKIRLMMFTWDTFIDYEGYDAPQRIDMPYRNNGAEEAMKVFNANFQTGITKYMSLNYLNLASLIDAYGGVTVDVSRAERNALNGMVASKKAQLQALAGSGLLSQMVVDMLAQEYYLNEFGPETFLNGLQAVAYGWLQYDSVYNCCKRDVEVIESLFKSVSKQIADRVAFYTDETDKPEVQGKRLINLDEMTPEDHAFFRQQMGPIFQMSYNNLNEEEINSISLALARVAYAAARQGVNVFDNLKIAVMPLEATQPYDIIAGAKGHIVDKEANKKAMNEFLYDEE